jgi:hypothetical protein
MLIRINEGKIKYFIVLPLLFSNKSPSTKMINVESHWGQTFNVGELFSFL